MNTKANISKIAPLRLSIWLLAVVCSISLSTQTVAGQNEMPPIPAIRQLSHDYIVKSEKDLVNEFATAQDSSSIYQLHTLIDDARKWIESSAVKTDNEKFKWLRGIHNLLFEFNTQLKLNKMNAVEIVAGIKVFNTAMRLSARGLNMSTVIENENSAIGNCILATGSFTDNIGYAAARDILVLKNCQNNPGQILQILDKQGADISTNRYADSLLIAAAFNNAEMVYNYAAAPSALGKKIQSIHHPLVTWIGRLAFMKTGRYYFPFLDELYTKRMSIDTITPLITEDQAQNYFSLLVRTRIAQVQRKKEGQTLVAEAALLTKLKSRVMELYVNDINGLHQTEAANIRFKKLENLSPEALYYIAVLGADELYTSSFVAGVYPLIIKKLGSTSTSVLFEMVHQDYFRKFISIAANYNTLQDFLAHMPTNARTYYMQSFASDLDTSPSLEDAVDVASAFSSITDTSIQNLLRTEIRKNKKSALYAILDTLCSAYVTNNPSNILNNRIVDAATLLGFQALQNSQHKIIIRQYFYGDKDGAQIFNAFVNSFNKPSWKINKQKYWTEVSSSNGILSIYANTPLDEKTELDLKAQDSLTGYLNAQQIIPTIFIHRGHSYYANHTIASIDSSAKLVLLGSCGGYQKLAAVLSRAPQAQVISSKQIGKGVINAAILSHIAAALEKGQDLVWPDIWKQLNEQLKGSAKSSFQDYIPPHKNIGLLLLKAFTAGKPTL
ncbi:MAG: hypothetical protein RL544_1335 [Bacteroidota bacterium]|jgi:hypothetical protein